MALKHSEATDKLFKAILSLDSIDECYELFEDLCTIKELLDMTQRLETAMLLDEGIPYQRIQEELKISSATIGRVNKCLNYGTGGYKRAIEKLKNENSDK